MAAYKNVFMVILVTLFSSQIALADSIFVAPTVIGESETVNRGYAGLKWTLGQGLTPEVVVGLRRAIVHPDGETEGGDISFSFNLVGGLHPEKLRVKLFNGMDNIQRELSGGYDFNKGFYGGLAIQGRYYNLGVDYHFTQVMPWEAYFILNTLKAYNKPARTLICPLYSVLDGEMCDAEHAHTTSLPPN